MFASIISRINRHWVSAKIIAEEDVDIYEYGLGLLLFSLLNIAAVLITALFTDKVAESMLLLAALIACKAAGAATMRRRIYAAF